MTRLWAIITALQAGRELGNVERWKNVQAVTAALVALLSALSAFLPPELRPDDAQVASLAGGAATLGSLLVVYWTYATSKRVGLPPGGAEPLDPPDLGIPRAD